MWGKITLILSLLLCLSVFAYNRTVYKKTSKRYYMTAIGQDKIQGGSEKAYAYARLDMDYIGEEGNDENHRQIFVSGICLFLRNYLMVS